MSAAEGPDPRLATRVRPRVVRVFISSTFADMKAERDLLATHVFPALRKRCALRGVVWGEVDLRWGITERQIKEGNLVPACLRQIRRCRPYFISMLGERYGSLPEKVPDYLLRRERWLETDRSVTELEILAAVFQDPETRANGLCYFRDPAYIDGLEPAEQANYREGPRTDEIARHGIKEAERRAKSRQEKLNALKERIRQAKRESEFGEAVGGLVLHDGYLDPESFAQLVQRDLEALVDRVFPEGSQQSSLDREAALHDAFAVSRTRVYVVRQDLFERLDSHVCGDGLPLAITGEPGIGKSALLANWILRYKEANPQGSILFHFVGASSNSADWRAMLRRLVFELKQRFSLGIEVPSRPRALIASFADALRLVADRTRLVLVVDALNQLEDREGAAELAWLPDDVPPTVRLVVSTLEAKPLEAWRRRGWSVLEIGPGEDRNERRTFVGNCLEAYLREHGQDLSAERTTRIAEAPQTENPLFLRSLIDELRVHTAHATLDDTIDHYLKAKDVPDLLRRILNRYEADYEQDRPNLVRDAFTALWAARKGLAESELLDLLGDDHGSLPQAIWSPLFLAAEDGLIDRSGLLGFFHDNLLHAVELAYLPDADARRAARLRLANYFDGDRRSNRAVEELPWQLAAAGSADRLRDLLLDRDFLLTAGPEWEPDFQALWSFLAETSPYLPEEAYNPALMSPGSEDIKVLGLLESLFEAAGPPECALRLAEHICYRAREDLRSLDGGLLVDTSRGTVEYRPDLVDSKQAEVRRIVLRAALERRALLLEKLGYQEEARKLLKDAVEVAASMDPAAHLALGTGDDVAYRSTTELASAISRANLAMVGPTVSQDGQLQAHLEVERLAKESGNEFELQAVYGNLGNYWGDVGNLDRSLEFHIKQAEICRRLSIKEHLAISLGNQAGVLSQLGRFDEALEKLDEQERIGRELGEKETVARALHKRALIASDRAQIDAALDLLIGALRLFGDLSYVERVRRVLDDLADILLTRQRDLGGPRSVMRRAEEIRRKVGDAPAMAMASHTFAEQGDVEMAEQILDRAAETFLKDYKDPNFAPPTAEQERRIRDDVENALGMAHLARILAQKGELKQTQEVTRLATDVLFGRPADPPAQGDTQRKPAEPRPSSSSNRLGARWRDFLRWVRGGNDPY